MRLEYKIDSNNSLLVIPSLNFRNNNTVSTGNSRAYYGPRGQFQHLGQQDFNATQRLYPPDLCQHICTDAAQLYFQCHFYGGGGFVYSKGPILKKGSQLTKPVNLNGYQSFRSFFTFSQPLSFIKSNVNLSTGFT